MTGPQGCGAPAGGFIAPADRSGEAVIEGRVTVAGSPPPTGYARLLNDSGEFVAEVPLSEDGGFRFFAAPGAWTVRVLSPGARAETHVTADYGHIAEIAVAL